MWHSWYERRDSYYWESCKSQLIAGSMCLCLCGFVYYVLCICVFFECVCAFSSFTPPFFFALNLINFHVKPEKRKFNQRTHCQRNGIDTQVRASKNNYTTTATTTWWNCSNMYIHPSFMVMVFHLNSAFKWTLLSMNTLICAYRIVVTMDVFWLITQKMLRTLSFGDIGSMF